ncbi:hypothetical protein [Carp edema virus]|nr:hypothetical protein [Carp edema virus]
MDPRRFDHVAKVSTYVVIGIVAFIVISIWIGICIRFRNPRYKRISIRSFV